MTRLLAMVAVLLCPAAAGATGFTDIGQDLTLRTETGLAAHGAFRLRGELLGNLDLDRGLTPSGAPLFPVPLADPAGQTLTHGDMRLRADVAAYAPGAGVAVKLRVDVLDNASLGGDAIGTPTATTSQAAGALRVKRAYAETATPVGLLAAGRMGAHWGLGMLANGGDCADCDSGDAADRIAFITPIAGLLWAAAYDFSSTGPAGRRRDEARALDLDPTDDARTVTIALLRWRDDAARVRRRAAGKTTAEWGVTASYRWQENDVPDDYLPVAQPISLDAGQVVARGYRATAVDLWFRLTLPAFRLEAEAALLLASLEEASLIPGVLLRDGVRSTQLGAALETEAGAPDAALGAGLDAGFASGDRAPGFGAFPRPTDPAPQPGDLDGAQAGANGDVRVDNFRFHPDYRIDRILFREIIGTVTDAVYLRPHARWHALRSGAGTLSLSLAAVVSFAVYAESTPGGSRPLGVELDPTIVYQSADGFLAALEHAVLVPLSGLDNAGAGLSAQPAQLVRLRLGWVF